MEKLKRRFAVAIPEEGCTFYGKHDGNDDSSFKAFTKEEAIEDINDFGKRHRKDVKVFELVEVILDPKKEKP